MYDEITKSLLKKRLSQAANNRMGVNFYMIHLGFMIKLCLTIFSIFDLYLGRTQKAFKSVERIVFAEAELGIESEMVVFYQFNRQSNIVFSNYGYKICTPIEYLRSKYEKRICL